MINSVILVYLQTSGIKLELSFSFGIAVSRDFEIEYSINNRQVTCISFVSTRIKFIWEDIVYN